MAKVFVRQTTAVFSVVILLLLMVCVGLLVVVLKSQEKHENSLSSPSSTRDKVAATTASTEVSPHSLMSSTKQLVTRSTGDMLSTTEANSVQQDSPATWENFRLPRSVLPLHYDLLLNPDLKNDTFNGNVNITVNVTQSVRDFIVHAYRLTISSATVMKTDDVTEVDIKRTFLYDPNEFFVMETEDFIPPGIYSIQISFTGSLVGSIVGFYKSRYTRSLGNQTRYLATSKFQPTYARRAFPCFDEPSFKSTFTVSLVHDPDYIALSNMPAVVTEDYRERNLKITRFEKSFPMVTYLACFIVCDFKFRETKMKNGKMFRVYATEEQLKKTEYALQFGSRVLEYFEDYFDISYPLPKQDMVAIPDFVSGAMEHWGVITFRETNLLYDELKSSPQNKQRVSTVISHEMAHMWFGNLVTMEWWDDLWLNEGFASYVEYKGVDQQHPEWAMMEHFITEDMQPVMGLDATLSSHPIVQPVSHPDEITEIFDGISYNKGASILRMLEAFVGRETFRSGISQFLKKYQFRNARTKDLWRELCLVGSKKSDRNISTIMDTWTKQMGFPYVTVIRDSDNSSSFRAYQQRFAKNPDFYYAASGENYLWSIPLSFSTSTGLDDIIWIHDDLTKNFTIPLSDTDWVKFNINQTGYYVVNYDKNEWRRLVELLKFNHELLTPSDRANLLFDAFLLAEAGHINYDLLMSMTMYLKNETHLIPWETAYASLVYISHLLEHTDVNILIKSYIKDLTKPLYNKLGWKEGDGHLNKNSKIVKDISPTMVDNVFDNSSRFLESLLRTTIIGLACHSGNEDCLSEASALFQNWTQGQQFPISLRSLVYHYGMAEIGREDHWNFMWERYLKEESPQERNALLYGLAHVKVPELIHRYLEYAMDETKIRRQDFFSILSYIAGNTVGRPIVWNFLRDKWKYLVERYTLNDRYLGFSVSKICSYFTLDFELEEMKSFFKKYPDAGAGKRAREQALEKVQNNIKWLQTHKQDVKNWLQKDGIKPWLYYRLPSHIIPLHYDLTLQPFLDEDKFSGSVRITAKVEIPSDVLLVHSHHLNITNTEVISADDKTEKNISETFYYEPHYYWVIQMSEKLPVGTYELYFEFEGNLTGSLIGFYKSSYTDPETKERRKLATSQYQSTYARRAFPCFDEPVFKSTFSVNVIHDDKHHALSNTMEMEIVQKENGFLETRFEKSVPMVTYLVCVIVSDFKYKEALTENGIRFRVYAAPHNHEKTQYALDIGSKIVTFFEKYFDIPYPLKKIDMVAVPDFRYGAMENWGLITYKERRLLVDEDETSINDKLAVAYIISHELAHFWFGNLVTMKWWDDLWLNEGFASFMKYKGVEIVEPTWNVMEQFATEDLYYALTLDGSANSHPIVQVVRNPNEITELFDTISYNKGSAVLRMLENLMGDDFRRGIREYLKQYSFGSADTQDLWVALSAASAKGLNVTTIMDTWTRQMNYPYVTVKRDKDDPSRYIFKQHHFLSEPENKRMGLRHSRYGYVWKIPLSYYSSESTEVQYIILNSTDEVAISLPDAKWVKFNANYSGYFLVNYGEDDWRNFVDILRHNHNIFSPSDRANLLFDSFALARAGWLSYEIPLNMTLYLKNETHIVPWKIAFAMMKQILTFTENDEDTRDMLKEHIRMLTKDLLRSLSLNDTGEHLERRLRILLMDAACGNGNYECLTSAEDMLEQWMNGVRLGPNIKALAYFYGMEKSGNERSWTHMWEKFLEEPSSQEKNKLILGLANIRNETILKRLMEFAADEGKIKRQDYFYTMSSIARNPDGHFLVWEFLRANWTSLVNRFTINDKGLGRFVKIVCSRFTTEKDLEKVQKFFRKNPEAGAGKRTRAETIEIIKNNIRWIQKHKDAVNDWLEKHVFMPWKHLRLPRSVVPKSYDLRLHPNMSTSSFEGRVKIVLDIVEPTNYIVVHNDKLTIYESHFTDSNDDEVSSKEEEFPFERNQFWVIVFSEELTPGNYGIDIKFRGKIGNNGYGILKLSYKNNITKEDSDLLVTQFQATHARRAFPCFDEPGFKSKFKIALVHDSDKFAVSNMPEEGKDVTPNGLTETHFEESVPMVTYLVCFLISDFDYTEATISDGKKLRIFAPPDRINKTFYALEMIPKMVETFEEYFNVSYALPKLDFVAVPNFSVLAMENWGLITHSEQKLLPQKGIDTRGLVEHIDQVVAHELAHQWFGNLVTMRWWNDLWLNEGFSTFAMYEAVRKLHPFADELAVSRIGKMMYNDAKLTSHPIVHSVGNPDEIWSLFDSISYQKGSAILRMLKYVLKDDFRKGVSNYLKKYKFSSAETQDLWNELSEASAMNINISEVMNTWTGQMGFPCIEIKRTSNNVTVKQEWYLNSANDDPENPQKIKESSYGYVWKVPLAYRDISTGSEEIFWLNDKSGTFPLKVADDAILKFNPDFFGYYIINYDENDWLSLSKTLRSDHKVLGVLDRYNIIHDAFMLAGGEKLMYDVALELTKYLINETEDMVWSLMEAELLTLGKKFVPLSETHTLWMKYVADLTINKFDDVLWNGTKNSNLNQKIMDLACSSHSPKCLQKIANYFESKEQGGKIDRYIDTSELQSEDNSLAWKLCRTFIYQPGVSMPGEALLYKLRSWNFGNEDLWNSMWQQLIQENVTSTDTDNFVAGLTFMQNVELIKRTLDLALEEEAISAPVYGDILEKAARNPVALPILWDYVQNNWNTITEKMDAMYFTMEGMISHMCGMEQSSEKVVQFLKAFPEVNNKVQARCLSGIQKRIDWQKKHEVLISNWLQWNVEQ